MSNKSALIIGVSIVVGCSVLGFMLKSPIDNLSGEINNLNSTLYESVNTESDSNRYQMISASENNIILLDTKTGEYWRKFIKNGQGPTNWAKESSPVVEE